MAAMDQVLQHVAQNMEKQLDAEIERYSFKLIITIFYDSTILFSRNFIYRIGFL